MASQEAYVGRVTRSGRARHAQRRHLSRMPLAVPANSRSLRWTALWKKDFTAIEYKLIYPIPFLSPGAHFPKEPSFKGQGADKDIFVPDNSLSIDHLHSHP